MDAETILRLLKNSGYYGLRTDGASIFMEDPSCVLRSFETFIEYAWVFIVCITVVLLFGWAMAMIRGTNNSAVTSIANNFRTLIIIFGTLGLAVPIVNVIWGADLFAYGCREIAVPIDEIGRLLDTRNAKMSDRDKYDLYEELTIFDSGTQGSHGYNTSISGAQSETSVNNTATQTMPTGSPIAATESGKNVIYSYADGTKYSHRDGTRSWRNNNPGNLRYSEFSRKAGAIASAGGFAVFPDEATGMAAIGKLLRTNTYSRLTITQAIERYAPPFENNTIRYNKKIEELTGLSPSMRVADLSDSQIMKMASAIRQIEVWTPGNITKEQ